MSKNATQLLVQINDRWKLDTDAMNNVQILQLVDVNKEHHKAKAGGPGTRWISRGWYGNLPGAVGPLLHKMAEAEQLITDEEARSLETLVKAYKDCTQQIVKAVGKVK